GASGAVRDAVRDQRDAVDALTEVAVTALGPPGPGARERIKETLNAGSLDPDVEEQLRAGRLSSELELPDVFGTLEPGARVTPTPRPRQTAPASQIADAERELELLRSRADELDRDAKRAVDAAADAHHDADEAARRLRELRRR